MPTRATESDSLAAFACPNPDCDRFNRFNAANLSVAERMGRHKAIRRLYCNHCGHRFSEREGSLLGYTKLPEQAGRHLHPDRPAERLPMLALDGRERVVGFGPLPMPSPGYEDALSEVRSGTAYRS